MNCRAAFAALLALTTGVWATTLEHLSLTQMVQKSSLIVRGTVEESGSAQRNGIIFTTYKVTVKDQLKGSTASSLTLEVPGGTYGAAHQIFSGAPKLAKDHEYVVFIWTSPSGHNQIIGLTQGLFDAAQGSNGEIILTQGQSSVPQLNTGGTIENASQIRVSWSDLAAKVAQEKAQ